MKRSAGLSGLARDHHAALVLAREAQRAATDCAALVARLRAAHAAALEPHFDIEERLLLPALEAAGEGAAAARTRAEHEALRAALAALDAADPATLRHYGELLQAHVRYEDRELFGLAERVLAPALLEAIGAAGTAT